jgi:hypothetical protein
MNQGPKGGLFDEKTDGQKSRDSVLLSSIIQDFQSKVFLKTMSFCLKYKLNNPNC